MSVSYAVDFASLLLLGPHETMFVAAGSAFSQCSLNKKERNPLYRTLFSIASLVITVQGAGLAFRLLGGDRFGDAVHRARPSAGGRRDGLLPAEHRPHRDGDRAVDARQHPDDLAQQLPVERAQLLRRRRHRGARGIAGGARRLLGGALHVRAALSHVSHLQGVHGAHRGRAAPRAADIGPAPRDDRSAGAGDRRQGSDDAAAHPAGAGLRGRSREGGRAAANTKSRASRRRRCCTTSASSRCPSTSCRSPDR